MTDKLPPSRARQLWEKSSGFCSRQFLALCLITGTTWALAWPLPGKTLGSYRSADGQWGIIQTLCIVIIFVCSGLQLPTSEMRKAVREYKAIAFGTLSILGITPMLAFLVMEIPFKPSAFQYGLAIFITMPTTLSAGVVLTTQAKGNTTLALLLVVITNLVAIVSVPFILRLVLKRGVEIDAIDLLLKLVLTVLCPLIFGKVLLESSKHVQRFCVKHKTALGRINSLSVCTVAWMALSRSRDSLIKQSAGDVFAIIAAAICVYVFFICFNWVCVLALRIPWRESKAVIINASQKTLPVALTIISFLNFPDKGLAVIPCVVGQLSQLLLSSILAAKWRALAEREERADLESSKAAAAKESDDHIDHAPSGHESESEEGRHDEPATASAYAGAKSGSGPDSVAIDVKSTSAEIEEGGLRRDNAV